MRLLTAVSLVRVQQGELKKQHRSKRPVFSSGNANPVRGMSAFTVITWLRGQAVKTSPFHGGNTGSIPVGVIWRHSQVVRQRSATPLSPVQIWLAPLGEIWKQLFPDFLVYKYNIPYIKMRYVKNVLPTSKNNRKYIENQLSGAIEQMEEYIRKYPMFLVMDYV